MFFSPVNLLASAITGLYVDHPHNFPSPSLEMCQLDGFSFDNVKVKDFQQKHAHFITFSAAGYVKSKSRSFTFRLLSSQPLSPLVETTL